MTLRMRFFEDENDDDTITKKLHFGGGVDQETIPCCYFRRRQNKHKFKKEVLEILHNTIHVDVCTQRNIFHHFDKSGLKYSPVN